MAPEQIADLPATDASDIYAIGVILYEALTGTLPYSGNFYSMLELRPASWEPGHDTDGASGGGAVV